MFADALRDNWWFGPSVVFAFMWTGYWLTLRSMRHYRGRGCEFIVMKGVEGMFGIYDKDVSAGRFIGATVVLASFSRAALVLLFRWLTVSLLHAPELYLALVGGLIMYDVVTHLRHLQSLWTWKEVASGDAVRGRIEYEHWFSTRRWGVDLLLFALLFLICFLINFNWIYLGGSACCLLNGWFEWRKSSALRSQKVAAG